MYEHNAHRNIMDEGRPSVFFVRQFVHICGTSWERTSGMTARTIFSGATGCLLEHTTICVPEEDGMVSRRSSGLQTSMQAPVSR